MRFAIGKAEMPFHLAVLLCSDGVTSSAPRATAVVTDVRHIRMRARFDRKRSAKHSYRHQVLTAK